MLCCENVDVQVEQKEEFKKKVELVQREVNSIIERVGQIRTRVMVDEPYSMPLIKFPVQLRVIPNAYGAIDGKKLYINPETWMPLPNNQAAGVVYHEWVHVAMMHPQRMRGKIFKVYNFACDFFINYHIKHDLYENKISLAPGMLYDSYYSSTWTTDAIYQDLLCEVEKRKNAAKENPTNQVLKDQILPQQEKSSGELRLCSREDAIRMLAFEEFIADFMGNDLMLAPDEGTDKELIREIIKAAELHKKSRGNLPGFMEMQLNRLRKARVPWDRVFHDLFLELVSGSEDRTFARPKRWALSQNMFLPSETGFKKQDIVLIVDTSGSMYCADVFERFVGELKKLMEYINSVTLISADVEVHEVVKINSISDVIGQHKKYKFKGGGGTDFRQALERASKIPNDIVIYYTDGYGTFGTKPRNISNLLWVLIEDCSVKPPFGKYLIATE